MPQPWHTSPPSVRRQLRFHLVFSFKGGSCHLRSPETQATGRKKQIHYQLLTLLCCLSCDVWAIQFLVPGCPELSETTLNDLFCELSPLHWTEPVSRMSDEPRGSMVEASDRGKGSKTTLLSSLFCFFFPSGCDTINTAFPSFLLLCFDCTSQRENSLVSPKRLKS